MVRTRFHRPSTGVVVAAVALFVALGGVATAAAVVPLAKRALVADNAKQLGGKTLAQVTAASLSAASQPGPASTAAGLVVVKSQSSGQLASGEFKELGSMSCDAGQKVMGGGLSSDGLVATFDSYPANDTTWAFSAGNLGGATANVSLWITCLK